MKLESMLAAGAKVAGATALAGLLLGTTGCSVLGAMTNPKASFAASEPAPMSLVVRRAEVARATSDEIDRLLVRTPMNEGSKWTSKTALTKEQAEGYLADAASDAVYTSTPGAKFRVVAAEAWLRDFAALCSSESKYPSLVAALGPDVQKKLDAIAEQEKQVAAMKGDAVKEQAAIDAKGASDADKEQHKKAKAELEEKTSKLEGEIEPKMSELVQAIGDAAGKADQATRDRLATPVVNLERAVDDAKAANAAALLRYPMALPTMTQEIQAAAKRILADIVEEKTGSRPDTNGLQPDVKLDGLEPKLTLNGVPADKLGGLSPGDMIGEMTKRLKAYVERVTLLAAYASETADHLAFQGKVLEAMHKGLKLDASKAKDAGVDVGEMKFETTPTPAKKADAKGAPKANRTPGGLAVASACAAPTPAAALEKQASAAPPPEKKKPSKAPASKGSVPAAAPSGPSVPATYSAAEDAPPPPSKKATKNCDVTVTNGNEHICL